MVSSVLKVLGCWPMLVASTWKCVFCDCLYEGCTYGYTYEGCACYIKAEREKDKASDRLRSAEVTKPEYLYKGRENILG